MPRLDPSTPYPPSKPGDEQIVIARTDAVATMHRPARMTCIAVRPAADDATVEHRFIGLLGSGAYRESVFAIPTVADRANEVLALAAVSEVSHTGRAIKNVVETLPRDLVFELDSQALAELVIDIVGLQERRIVRVFDVAEPVGPWTTVFVYVPRVALRLRASRAGVSRRRAALRQRVARRPDVARLEFAGARSR